MSDQTQHRPARLIEVELGDGDNETKPKPGGRDVAVQFNPESLKVTRANTVAKTETAGSSAMQFVATTSTKLDLELWFDATVTDKRGLRELTEGVYYFITPDRASGNAKFKVPGVRFHWGEFIFDGVLTSLNETLELFSADGRPLRSRMSLEFTSQDIRFRVQGLSEDGSGGGVGPPGRTPQTPVKQGDSVQQLAAQSGMARMWKAIAAANGIENPRLPQPGTLLSPPRIGGR